MGRFFFDIREGGELVDDPDGQDCATIEAARALAVAGLRELIASDVREGLLNTALAIEIADESRRRVDTVTFRDAVTPEGDPRHG